MNTKHKQKLFKAIDLAKRPGSCKYLSEDDEPLCVIAQLATLEGEMHPSLKQWDQQKRTAVEQILRNINPLSICDYDSNLLGYLQRLWDSNDPSDLNSDIRKETMKNFVNQYFDHLTARNKT